MLEYKLKIIVKMFLMVLGKALVIVINYHLKCFFRWLLLCNPLLADVISDKIGDQWPIYLDQLVKLKEFADDEGFQR